MNTHHEHTHNGAHTHANSSAAADPHAEAHRPHPEPVVLEIGGELGALLIYTNPQLLHAEIEISPHDDDWSRSHKDVLERVVDGRSVYVAVFDRLAEGTYTIWRDDRPLTRCATIAAGAVTELDWTGR